MCVFPRWLTYESQSRVEGPRENNHMAAVALVNQQSV